MKKCKKNYIKILTAMRDNSNDVAKQLEKNGNPELAQKVKAEVAVYQDVIWLLSDYDNSFEEYGKIYFPEEFEK